ncbi:fibronectin type III domain-containing protein 7 [Spea bombifrons]|uniref:fibronectin type III domain-containing protein 7 n=1 Tax=Spea bombifrons TaxID=233779 RepID=UPI00234B0556|nr:fibronectin type III domain-containing protein 7 [Spea bombifrons]
MSSSRCNQRCPPATQYFCFCSDISMSVYDVTSRSVYVRWSKVAGAMSYKITAIPVMSLAQPTFAVFNSATILGTINTLLPNTNYEVAVEALNQDGIILAQVQKVQMTAPEVPIIEQTYSKLSNSITVEWPEVPGASRYLVTAQDGKFFSETIVSSSPGTVTGLQPATSYRITVRSINDAGKSQPSRPRNAKTVLAAPLVSVVSPTSDSVSVSWQVVPSAALYSVSVMRSDGLGNRWNQNTTGTSINFTSLDPGTIYTIKVHAWDAHGTPGDDVTYNQIIRPICPSDLQITFDSGALEATFAVIGAEATTNYTVFVSNGIDSINCTMSASPCIISDLQCGMEYTVSLAARNDAGSTMANRTWLIKSVPCAPSGITIMEENPGNLTVSWSDVELAEYYVVFVKSDDGLEVHCNTSQTVCFFPAECGFIYFMSVFAYNKAGQSPLGEILNYTTAPCCPSDFSPGYVSTDTLEIIWSAVRGAEMYETKADDGTNVILCNDTATVCALSGLQCDTQYNVTVYSYSENRGSNTSCASKAVRTAPCSPEITNITKINTNTFTIYWDSSNFDAVYTVTARGSGGEMDCTNSDTYCSLENLPCGALYMVSVVATAPSGTSLPSYSVPLETDPCCPSNLSVVQVTQSVTNVSWSVATGAQTYTTMLVSPRGQAKCHTLQNHCLLGCITCGTSYSVSIEATSQTGLTAMCTYHGYSSSACCPSGVKLYRLSNSGIRVTWRASSGPANYTVNLYGSKGNFTCVPNTSYSYCDLTDIQCGDVYTVVVSPISSGEPQLSFCPKKIYSVTCSGSSLGMVIYRGKRSVS